ncbi:hypothetical protein D3C78_701860 [compost metagenome]
MDGQRHAGVLALADHSEIVGQQQQIRAAQGLLDILETDRSVLVVTVDQHLQAAGLDAHVVAQDAQQAVGILEVADTLLHHHQRLVGTLQCSAGEVVDLPWQVHHHPVVGAARQVQQSLQLLCMDILWQAQLGAASAQHVQVGVVVSTETTQRQAIHFAYLLQHFDVTVSRLYIEIMRHAAELQIEVDQ